MTIDDSSAYRLIGAQYIADFEVEMTDRQVETLGRILALGVERGLVRRLEDESANFEEGRAPKYISFNAVLDDKVRKQSRDYRKGDLITALAKHGLPYSNSSLTDPGNGYYDLELGVEGFNFNVMFCPKE